MCALKERQAIVMKLIIVTNSIVIMLGAVAAGEYRSPPNLVENGSFESTNHNSSTSVYLNFQYVAAPSHVIHGWFVADGSVNWGKGRWNPSSDGSLCAVQLNGDCPGTIETTMKTIENVTVYTFLVDTAHQNWNRDPNTKAETAIPVAFSVSIQAHKGKGNNGSIVTLNSTLIKIHWTGSNGNKNLAWQTKALIFNTTEVSGPVTLTLSSRSPGLAGAVVDNVRVFPGRFFTPDELSHKKSDELSHKKSAGRIKELYIVIGTAIGSLFAVSSLFAWIYIRRKRSIEKRGEIQSIRETIQIFPYRVIKAATKNFDPKCKLGQGGFGPVFKGVLPDGTAVAVKQLSSTSFQGQAEFLNEISLISRVRHENLVILKGCSIKGKERLLVYEFLENRSLHQALLDKRVASPMAWPTRMKIAVGTARGLVYMHEESGERIVHRDIKASNILLDKDFNAKIADFGLAKIFEDDETHITTRVAGTLGYLSPEYALRGQLTEKADIFSFGIVALEIVSGRTNTDTSLPTQEQYLLDWAYHLLEDNRIIDIVDPELGNEYNVKEAERLIHSAILCTRVQRTRRPSMSHLLSIILGEAPIPNTL